MWRNASDKVWVAYTSAYHASVVYTGHWRWRIYAGKFDVRGHFDHKTAAGARAACERVAGRLGVVC